MKRTRRDSFGRSVMKLLCTLLGLVLVVMLCFTFGFQTLLKQMGGTGNDLDLLSRLSQRVEQQGISSLTALGNRRDVVNILLIGQDGREGESQARSDSMILCSFHKERDTLTVTSILRDLYVPIPGHGSNRINAAYAFGGMDLLKKTLSENLDVTVSGCVEVDFSQFSQIVDTLGGVELELRSDEAAYINKQTGGDLSAGVQRLDGQEALTYSRIRSLDQDADFSRTGRQRKVLVALLEQVRGLGVAQLLPTVRTLLPMIRTDLNSGQLLLLAVELAPHLADCQVESRRIPADDTFSDATIDGMAVLKADLDANREMLKQWTE